MNRRLALALAAALLAGCAGGAAPDPAPEAGVSAAVSAGSAALAAAPPDGAATERSAAEAAERDVPERSADPAPADPPADHAPEGAPAPEMIRVPAPALADLPAELREELTQVSPWEAAQRAALWQHGLELAVPLAVAPDLAEELAGQRPTDADRVWVRLVETWDEGDAFYFRVEVTRRDRAGRLVADGVDVIAVSPLEGGAPLVTGYARDPANAAPQAGEVAVWTGAGPDSSVVPTRLALPAPVVADGVGLYHVPADALEALGEVVRLQDGAVALTLSDGTRTAAMPVTAIGGYSYVSIDDVVAAADGVSSASAAGSEALAVEWRPDLGQLCLWRDSQHPIS